MSAEKLDLWDKLKQPPPEALSTIAGGRLQGMTDIKPQWRYEALTEQFGPCGFGWKYTIEKLWLEPGDNGEVFAFAWINLYIRGDESQGWSCAIPGIGGSKLLQREHLGQDRERLYNNDEAYKMSITDALSVAFKMLGGGADVHMGRWDGSKYAVQEDADAQTSKMIDWLAACKAAVDGPHEDFIGWWPKHKDQIKEDCGQVKAADVYNRFLELKKGLPDEDS